MVKEIIKKKKKKWYPILASQEFRQIEIGETITSSPNSLINRTINVNLAQLTKDMKKQNLTITFRINGVKEDKALTEVKKYFINPSSIKRITSRDKNKIIDSFKAKTKDNINIRIKPLLITKSKTKKSVLTSLRKATREILTKEINSKTYSELISSLLDYRMIIQIKNKLKKIYPLSTFQIKALIKE